MRHLQHRSTIWARYQSERKAMACAAVRMRQGWRILDRIRAWIEYGQRAHACEVLRETLEGAK